jgi:Protein of unknown function (DUF4435)
MRENLTADRYVNTIQQQRSTFAGTFLLVEGRSDKIAYGNSVDNVFCQFVVTGGKENVIKVLNSLEKFGCNGVLAIVDADFDHLESLSPQSPNLLRTDTHDLETMILQSPALDRILEVYASEDKLKGFGRDVRATLLEAGMSIGYFLWVSISEDLNLIFDNIDFSKFIDKETLAIDENKMIKVITDKSQQPGLNNAATQQKITAKRNSKHDPWQVCRGHDLVEILSIGLRKAIGSNKAIDVEACSDERKNTLENQLILAYGAAYFFKTQLYQEILAWESNNYPFQILPHD